MLQRKGCCLFLRLFVRVITVDTEALKATNPLRWTGLMNNLRHSAEELVLSDLIYA